MKARARRSAAITASVPEFEKRTSSAAGTILEMRLGHRVLALGAEREHAADLHARAGGLIHARVRVAEDAGAVGEAVVDVLVAVDVA